MVAMHKSQTSTFITNQNTTKTTYNIKNVRNYELQGSWRCAQVHREIYEKLL